MLATLIVVFRELIEVGLVVGIILAATRGVPARGRWVATGVAAGAVGACIVALFAKSIGAAMEGMGQEWFNAGILGIAVIMLVWHQAWMAHHGRQIAQEMKHLGHAVTVGERSLTALAVVCGVATLREGSEVVLFLYGIAVSGGESTPAMLTGGAIGLLMGMALSALMYLGLLKLHTKHLFRVTGIMIALLAAGMAAQAASFLQAAGTIEGFTQTMWDSSAILSEQSLLGKALHTLIGYMDRPNSLQLMVYAATLAVMYALTRALKPKAPPVAVKP